jgi:hypothetical protein
LDLSMTFYPVFRPNLGVCSLGVFLWDASAHAPWAALYGRNYWHLAMPTSDLIDLELEGLRYDRLETLNRYRVRYQDADVLSVDLEYTGLRQPHEAAISSGSGHFDQPCHVEGTVRLRGDTFDIDTIGMRDRSWSVRPEDRRETRVAYTFGNASTDDQFLLMTSLDGNQGHFLSDLFTGYLVRDGVQAPLTNATRRVLERTHGFPVRIEIEATDQLGRRLHANGHTRNRLANQATPSQFSWMSMTEWHAEGMTYIGEVQEVWSPDQLGPGLLALNTSPVG